MFNIQSTCFILALFVRDDGERFLLGDGMYEFADKQLHFAPNSIQSDIVELQGSDGQLLAGQVMRSSKQTFEGIIGDQTTSRTDIENARRRFINFFKTRHKYQVIYVLPDGRSITRYKGFIVEAPSAQELYQLTPKFSVALMFEELPYYAYAEDDEGNPDFTDQFLLQRSTRTQVLTGGLKWDAVGAVWQGAPGTSINICDVDGLTASDSTTSAEYETSGGYGLLTSTFKSKVGPTLTNFTIMQNVAKSFIFTSNPLPIQTNYVFSIYTDNDRISFTARLYQREATGSSAWSAVNSWSAIGSQQAPYTYAGRTPLGNANGTLFQLRIRIASLPGYTVDSAHFWYQIELGETAHPWQSGAPLPPSDDKGAEWEEATIIEGENNINKLDLFTTAGEPVIPNLRLSPGTYSNITVHNLTNNSVIHLNATFTLNRVGDYLGEWYGFQLEQGINEIVMTADQLDGTAQLVWNSGVVG